jgi:hypothetical protein
MPCVTMRDARQVAGWGQAAGFTVRAFRQSEPLGVRWAKTARHDKIHALVARWCGPVEAFTRGAAEISETD